jgi:hypothetical protein
VSNVRHINFRNRSKTLGGGGIAEETIEVRLLAEHVAMLDRMSAEGGFADRAECAASILEAVLDDDAKAHET